MKAPNLHLNLLREQEICSSSPIRVHVLLPALAALACVAMLGWWGMLWMQESDIRSRAAKIQADLDMGRAEYGKIRSSIQAEARISLELGQLALYRNARRPYGETLARLAEVMPEQVQLLSVEIPEQPPQDLRPPKVAPGMKYQPLPGPTNPVESVSFKIVGRTGRSDQIQALLTSLAQPAFSNVLDAVGADGKGPRIQFGQEAAAAKGRTRLLAFDIEYKCRERRFEK